MDEPARPIADGPADPLARWAATLPPPRSSTRAGAGEPRFAPLSPRVAVLIGGRDRRSASCSGWRATASGRSSSACCSSTCSIRRSAGWSDAACGDRSRSSSSTSSRSSLFIEFLALTLTPLVNEILRFVDRLPAAGRAARRAAPGLGEFYQRLEIPLAIRDWIDSLIAGIGQGGGGGGGLDLSFLLPLITGAGSLIGAVFGYFILPVWVAYLLKDQATLVAPSTGRCPPTWRFDTWAVIRTVERASASGSAARSSSASRSASPPSSA